MFRKCRLFISFSFPEVHPGLAVFSLVSFGMEDHERRLAAVGRYQKVLSLLMVQLATRQYRTICVSPVPSTVMHNTRMSASVFLVVLTKKSINVAKNEQPPAPHSLVNQLKPSASRPLAVLM